MTAAFELRGRRLVLRRFEYADAQDLLSLDDNDRVRRYLIDDPVDTPTQALLLVDHLLTLYADGRGLGIWHASDEHQQFLGHFSLMPVSDTDDVEIGVRLGPQAWGKHYALEGGRLLCQYGFEQLQLPRIVGFCDPENRVVDVLLRRLRFDALGLQTIKGREVLAFSRENPRQVSPEDRARQDRAR
ncbi:MAG: GNAT family N-acetyltransferase [Gammaproteobacteria bacterium]